MLGRGKSHAVGEGLLNLPPQTGRHEAQGQAACLSFLA